MIAEASTAVHDRWLSGSKGVDIMTAESPLPVICPKCHIPLVRYQPIETKDIVFCPQCGAGGDYKEVLEDKGNLAEGFVTEKQIDEILHELRISPP